MLPSDENDKGYSFQRPAKNSAASVPRGLTDLTHSPRGSEKEKSLVVVVYRTRTIVVQYN
jgi:hypothetical protein